MISTSTMEVSEMRFTVRGHTIINLFYDAQNTQSRFRTLQKNAIDKTGEKIQPCALVN